MKGVLTDPVVLIDTSVWIQLLNGRDPSLKQEVEGLRVQRRARLALPIVAELLQGTKSEEEERRILELEAKVPFLQELGDTWREAGRLSRRIRTQGQTVPLLDCYLAALALGHGAAVFTLDKHFEPLRRACGLELQPHSRI